MERPEGSFGAGTSRLRKNRPRQIGAASEPGTSSTDLTARSGAEPRSGRCRCEQLRHPHQVVRRADQVRGELRPFEPFEASLPEIRHRLEPAEDLFDALAKDLADCVARMARGAAVDR